MIKIGLILGYTSNFDLQLPEIKELECDTPYGKPNSPVYSGIVNDKEIFIVYRHGKEMNIPSYKVNFKANIYALYELGCKSILATSVCGSLQEEICPGEFVIFDQFVDLTTHSELTFSDKIGIEKLNHSSFSQPFANEIRDILIEASVVNKSTTHTKGIVMAVDGPRQSTRAESNLYRRWGADVINTTTTPEAILCHELKIKYGAIALCTYYDTWRTDIPPATRAEKQEIIDICGEQIAKILKTSVGNFACE
jgi:5'-methylthioadenosine phosphorylase